jgi:hypothetical protein
MGMYYQHDLLVVSHAMATRPYRGRNNFHSLAESETKEVTAVKGKGKEWKDQLTAERAAAAFAGRVRVWQPLSTPFDQ